MKAAMMPVRDAYVCYRVLMRLEFIADRLVVTGERETALSLYRLIGAMQYRIFGGASIVTLEGREEGPASSRRA